MVLATFAYLDHPFTRHLNHTLLSHVNPPQCGAWCIFARSHGKQSERPSPDTAQTNKAACIAVMGRSTAELVKGCADYHDLSCCRDSDTQFVQRFVRVVNRSERGFQVTKQASDVDKWNNDKLTANPEYLE